MATQRQVELILAMRDDATSTLRNFENSYKRFSSEAKNLSVGSEQWQKAAQSASQAKEQVDAARVAYKAAVSGVREFGQQTDQLTKFVREQRQENRLQSFVFRESAQSLGAMALGLSAFTSSADSGSEGMKKLSKSLNEGFLAFQGLDFALSALGAGPMGMLVAVLGGLTAAFASVSESAEKSTKVIKDQKSELDLLIDSYGKWRDILHGTSEDNKAASEQEIKLLEAQANAYQQVIENQKAGAKSYNIILNDQKMSSAELLEAQMAASKAIKSTLEENQKTYNDLRLRIVGVRGAMNEVVSVPIEQKFGDMIAPTQLLTSSFENLRDSIPFLSGVDVQPLNLAPTINNLAELNFSMGEIHKELSLATIGSEDFFRAQARFAELKKKYEEGILTPLEKTQKKLQEIAPLISKGFGLIAMASAQSSQAQIDDAEQAKAAALAGIDARIAKEQEGSIAYKQLQVEKAKIEQQYDSKIRAAKRDAFESDKQARIIESIMNTAVAVTQALPNFILAGIVGAMGLAETAIIASQPTPKFHQGGVVKANGLNSDEVPAILRVGETVRTPEQEAELKGGTTINFNFNAPVSDEEFVWRSIQARLIKTGLPIDRLAVTSRGSAVL